MKLTSSFHNVRLRSKMLMIYFLSVFIPVILTNVIFYNITTNNVKNQKMRDISLAMEQMRNELMNQADAVIGIATVLYTDSILNDYLDTRYVNDADYVFNYHSYITDMLEKYTPVYRAIQRITLYTNNDTIIYGGYVYPISEINKQASWYKKLEVSGTANPIIVEDSESPSKPALSVVVRMSNTTGQNVFDKIIKIDLHPELVKQILSNVTLEGNVYLMEGDKVHYKLYSGDNGMSEESEDGAIIIEENMSNKSYFNNWRIVGKFQERQVLEEVRKSKEFVIYMALPNILIPSLIIIWFTRSLNQRLFRILRQMKRVKNHNFELIENEEATDEIGQLTAEFNHMTMQLRSLIHDVYMADIQKKELELGRKQSQLHALQSQINPHFLFNSLETIRMRSLMKSEEETAKIIHHLAKIFRKSLSWGRDLVSVRDELDLVDSFLQIQKYRFGDKLNYAIEVDDDCVSSLIPKMTLQPLVENSSIHGIEPMKQPGFIRVSVRKSSTGPGIVCTIADNGVGMSEEKLAQLQYDMNHSEELGESIGMRNVFLRLKLFYGDEAKFSIDSAKDQGTTIRIEIRSL
ncbi:two-component system sensor histidine kinase YesM [Paenibacillus taihuensis]|uniref:Two-component system sensor histidine kinase YesM n=1 Tax=Paenibacillus taihuensis TaxID=1156355 RepID=A0A3D9Q0I1_9BACL|nr:sensor histidine kinase [Paenibacillus taihuensis]REE56319.1 two-component system sensor histidine kinase YesM [Paenibacillus taihuensis]